MSQNEGRMWESSASKKDFPHVLLAGDAMAGTATHHVCESLLDPPGSAPILDVGAGQGAFSQRLFELGYKVWAIGISPHQFVLGNSVPYFLCDVEAGIPLKSASVSGIIAIEVLEHLEAPFHLFREASRCLPEGGSFLLTTPNVLSISSKLSFVFRDHMIQFGDEDFLSNGHISPVSLPHIRRMAKMSGFLIEHVTYNVGKLPIPRLRHFLPLRAPMFRTKFLGESLIVKLRRTGATTVPRNRG